MDDLHEWVSLRDDEATVWLLDATFLTSNWRCIYGEGCSGVGHQPEPELEQGCCSHGAHLSDDDDRERVLHFASRLTAQDWQYCTDDISNAVEVDADGDGLTAKVDSACIFLNRPDFGGGAGCALHRAALRHGERPLDWKPEVCWQLPLRLDNYTDDNGQVTMLLREWKRADWGAGGAEFHWWCTEDDTAFVDQRSVFETMRDEIVELVGRDVYDAFSNHVAARGVAVFVAHPTHRTGG
ncbi:MAG: hypothetical protein V3V01_05765 [Acidimicrobiales bacterium]